MNQRLFLLSVIGLLLTACTEYHVIKTDSTPVNIAQSELPQDQLLDVGVAIFDLGLPEDDADMQENNIFPHVREAEARYMPFQLRRTLEKTGNWGAVRAIPANAIGVDLMIFGTIITSDGEALVLKIETRDATGRVWLNKEYSQRATRYAYQDKRMANRDPFQAIYHEIANDLLEAKRGLARHDIASIRTVAELRFAKDFSQEAFANHVRSDESGQYFINRLPAKSDPMMSRIRLIRESDDLIIDTFDGHYARLHSSMRQAYRSWRKSSYEEMRALRKMQRSSKKRVLVGSLAMVGGVAAALGGSPMGLIGQMSALGGATMLNHALTNDDTKIHRESLRELSESFDTEITPQVVAIEGKTITLKGSAQNQYDSWRRMLRNVYLSETGFAQP